MPADNLSTDQPLALPRQTLDALEKAHAAAGRARQAVEVSLALPVAGGGLAVVGMGSSMLVGNASFPVWIGWPLVGLATLMLLGGVVLMYWHIWSWLRRGRRGGPQSPLGDACTQLSRRKRFGFFAMILVLLFAEQIGFMALKGHISDDVYYGFTIWGTRLAVLMGVGFFAYRCVRSGFWEYSIIAAGIAGTVGLYIFVNPGRLGTVPALPASIAAASMLATLVAAASLVGRWRRWTRANQAAAARDEAAAAEAT